LTPRSVPGFSSIIGQTKPVKLLTTLLNKGTIPHALLFTGIDGIGKRTAAKTLAMACNCTSGRRSPTHPSAPPLDPPCGQCRSCRKIESGAHPDILTLAPTDAIIRIAQVRQLCETLALKPYEARQRVVILSDAQALNPEAGNALLKILEEPPDRTLLVLTARQNSDLLPTIVSRCQHIRFGPLSASNVAKLLTTSKDLDPDTASIIAQLSHGSFTRALKLHRDNWIPRRDWLIDGLTKLPSQSVTLKLAWAAQLGQNKAHLEDALEVLQIWLRDLAVFPHNPQKIINKDLTDKIQYASQRVDPKALTARIHVLAETQKKIQANANIRLALETMVLQMTKPGPQDQVLNV